MKSLEEMRKECLEKYGEIAPDNILEFVLQDFQEPSEEAIRWAESVIPSIKEPINFKR